MIRYSKMAILAATLCTASLSFAGERVEGNGLSKESAAQATENRAARQAKARGTCASPVKLSECKRESDGSWTCYSTVANHKGSC